MDARMPFNRRSFLKTSLALSAFAAVPRARAQNAGASDGFTILEAREGEARLRGENQPATPIFGYNGVYPAQPLRIRKGEELKLRLVNKLSAPTSLHFRGMRGPNVFDGVAPLTQQALAPGATQDIRFTPPDAGTFFFHPHAPGMAEQHGRGLGGVLIVEEDKPPQVDHEIVFALADWKLDDWKGPEGPVANINEAYGPGRLGAHVTINGAPAPFKLDAAPGARVRLRIVNMSMAAIVAFTFEGVMPMIAAIDSQPCLPFEPVNRTFPAGPGARFDILFDMPDKDGESAKVVLRRWPLANRPEIPPADIALFAAKGARRAPLPPIAPLGDNATLPATIPMQNAHRLDLTIERSRARGLVPGKLWTFNGQPMDVANSKPLFSVRRGTPLTLGFVNSSDVPHVMRVHGHVVRQLHLLDDGWEPYWRDGVIVPDGKTVRVALLADNPGKWRVGSGILAHAEHGLSAWFEVT